MATQVDKDELYAELLKRHTERDGLDRDLAFRAIDSQGAANKQTLYSQLGKAAEKIGSGFSQTRPDTAAYDQMINQAEAMPLQAQRMAEREMDRSEQIAQHIIRRREGLDNRLAQQDFQRGLFGAREDQAIALQEARDKQAIVLQDKKAKDALALQEAKEKSMRSILAEKNEVKEKPASYQERLAKMGAEERKRFDSAAMGLNAVDLMKTALIDEGENTFSLIGDNSYTMAMRNFTEALGRMQSGGAINAQEEERFRLMAPKWNDSADIQKRKLAQLNEELSLRVQNLGFSPDEVRSARAAVAERKPKPRGFELVPSAYADPASPSNLKSADEMSEAELDAELEALGVN